MVCTVYHQPDFFGPIPLPAQRGHVTSVPALFPDSAPFSGSTRSPEKDQKSSHSAAEPHSSASVCLNTQHSRYSKVLQVSLVGRRSNFESS